MEFSCESEQNSTWFSIPSSVNEGEAQHFFLIDLEPHAAALKSAPVEPTEKTLYELVVVLDCSGSMSGTRIKLATGILKELMENPLVESMTIIKFGSNVESPRVFTKQNSGDILAIKADCGGTNFRPAITKLMEVIETPVERRPRLLERVAALFKSSPQAKEARKTRKTAIFFSDGEAGTPSEMYAPLQKVLSKHNCPLLSVAVTTNAQPELMINLSQLYGNLELVLLMDNDNAANGLALIEDKLCMGLELFEGALVVEGREGPLKKPVSFREGQEKLFVDFASKAALDAGEVQFALALKGREDAPLRGKARALDSFGSVDERLARLREITGFLMKESISKVAQKTMSKEEGLGFVRGLRNIVVSCSVEENYFKEIERLRKDKSDANRLQEILKRQKELKTNTLELQTTVNRLEDLISGGDLRAALETYSAKTVSNRVNRRAMQIAQRNAEKNLPSSLADWVVKRILESAPDQKDKELPECILWCINHIDAGVEGWRGSGQPLDVSGLDWVGRGCLVTPGKTASLNAWGLQSVQIRPVNISNNSVAFVKVSQADNGRRLATIKGIDLGEFNCSVPFAHPDENIAVHRLATAMIKGTQEGTRAFSNLFCGSPDLFAIEQVFAFYSVASLTSLANADKTVHFEDSARALLSLWDLAFFSQKDADRDNFCVRAGGNASDDYVKEAVSRLAADPREFIASKEDTSTPDFLRLFYLLLVGDTHLQAALQGSSVTAFLSQVKFLLFARRVLDLTSSRFLLKDFLGFAEDEYRSQVMLRIEADQGLEGLCGKFAPKADLSFLRLHKMAKALDILRVLDEFKRAKGCATFRELHCKILRQEVPFAEFAEELKKTRRPEESLEALLQRLLEVSPERLAALKFAEDARLEMDVSVSLRALVERLVVVCVQKHTVEGNVPRHGSTYNKATLESFGDWEALCSDKFNQILLKQMKSVEGQALGQLGQAQKQLRKIKTLIQKIERFNRLCPLERMCFPYRETELSYSGDDLPSFPSRIKMFLFLHYNGYGPELLAQLKALDLGSVIDVDPRALLQKKSRYLHGVSFFAEKNLEKSKSAEEFRKLMLPDMEKHYEQKNAEGPTQYVFGDIRKKHLARVCDHLFLENQIYAELRRSDKADEGELCAQVLQAFPDCLTQNGYDEAVRKEHLRWLAKAKLQETFPFN